MQTNWSWQRRGTGFSLVELLVVIAIISLLGMFMLGVVRNSVDGARLAGCAVNQKNLGVAIHQYVRNNGGMLLPSNAGPWEEFRVDGDLKGGCVSFDNILMRDMGLNFTNREMRCPWVSANFNDTIDIPHALFGCPADDIQRTWGPSEAYIRSYALNGHWSWGSYLHGWINMDHGPSEHGSAARIAQLPAPGNTFLAGERPNTQNIMGRDHAVAFQSWNDFFWADQRPTHDGKDAYFSRNNWVYCDGHVAALSLTEAGPAKEGAWSMRAGD